MNALLWTSVLLGVALGAANAAASLLLVRAARGRAQGPFLRIVFGGMLARMSALLAVYAAILAWAVVDRTAFTLALGATIAAGLAVEVLLVGRAPRAIQKRASATSTIRMAGSWSEGRSRAAEAPGAREPSPSQRSRIVAAAPGAR